MQNPSDELTKQTDEISILSVGVKTFVHDCPPSEVFKINPPGGIHPVPPQEFKPPTAKPACESVK